MTMKAAKTPHICIPVVSLPVAGMDVIGGDMFGYMLDKDDANCIRLTDASPLLLVDRQPILLADGVRITRKTRKTNKV